MCGGAKVRPTVRGSESSTNHRTVRTFGRTSHYRTFVTSHSRQNFCSRSSLRSISSATL
jgi:hypothetical protein